MLAYFVFELRRLVREPRLAIFAIITPVISYMVFQRSPTRPAIRTSGCR